MKTQIPTYIKCSPKSRAFLQEAAEVICRLSHASELIFLEEGQDFSKTSAVKVIETPNGPMSIGIELAGNIDVPAYCAKIARESAKIQSDLEKLNKKLNLPSFHQKAPAALVLETEKLIANAEEKLRLLIQDKERMTAL